METVWILVHTANIRVTVHLGISVLTTPEITFDLFDKILVSLPSWSHPRSSTLSPQAWTVSLPRLSFPQLELSSQALLKCQAALLSRFGWEQECASSGSEIWWSPSWQPCLDQSQKLQGRWGWSHPRIFSLGTSMRLFWAFYWTL